jgi:hypothetical protein
MVILAVFGSTETPPLSGINVVDVEERFADGIKRVVFIKRSIFILI